MPSLQITAWNDAVSTSMGDVLQEEIVSIGAGSLQSGVIVGSGVFRKVRMYADSDCFVTWGANPTATTDGTSGRFLGANNPEYFQLEAGERVAVIERV